MSVAQTKRNWIPGRDAEFATKAAQFAARAVLKGSPITDATWAGGVGTVTVANNFSPGQPITIHGSNPSDGWDGNYTVATASATQFTTNIAVSPTTPLTAPFGFAYLANTPPSSVLGVTSADLLALSAAQSTWLAAYAAYVAARGPGKEPGTVIVDAKNDARKAVETLMRGIGAIVSAWVKANYRLKPSGLPLYVAVLMSYGIDVPDWLNAAGDSGRHPRKPPVSGPELHVTAGGRATLTVDYGSQRQEGPGKSGLLHSRAKPPGVLTVNVQVTVHGEPISLGENPQNISLTRTPQDITFPARYIGKRVSMIGQYAGTKGQTSEWGEPEFATIPGDPVMASRRGE